MKSHQSVKRFYTVSEVILDASSPPARANIGKKSQVRLSPEIRQKLCKVNFVFLIAAIYDHHNFRACHKDEVEESNSSFNCPLSDWPRLLPISSSISVMSEHFMSVKTMYYDLCHRMLQILASDWSRLAT